MPVVTAMTAICGIYAPMKALLRVLIQPPAVTDSYYLSFRTRPQLVGLSIALWPVRNPGRY